MNYLITKNCLALKTQDSLEILVKLKKVRLSCPCANCSGEKDVFGNVYKARGSSPLLKSSYEIRDIQPVGNYGIKIFWGDNHSNGIYTFDFLKKLSCEN